VERGVEAGDRGDAGQRVTHEGEGFERLGQVEWGQVHERLDPSDDRRVDEDGIGERRPPVDDTVADRVDPAERADRGGDVGGIDRAARRRYVGRGADRVVRLEEAQLEAARPRVDDEDPAAAQYGHAQSRISGMSRPSIRVYARARSR
jgi:hypothetical protein